MVLRLWALRGIGQKIHWHSRSTPIDRQDEQLMQYQKAKSSRRQLSQVSDLTTSDSLLTGQQICSRLSAGSGAQKQLRTPVLDAHPIAIEHRIPAFSQTITAVDERPKYMARYEAKRCTNAEGIQTWLGVMQCTRVRRHLNVSRCWEGKVLGPSNTYHGAEVLLDITAT
jgi:hypothetical protein